MCFGAPQGGERAVDLRVGGGDRPGQPVGLLVERPENLLVEPHRAGVAPGPEQRSTGLGQSGPEHDDVVAGGAQSTHRITTGRASSISRCAAQNRWRPASTE